jgi:hypothetical protein
MAKSHNGGIEINVVGDRNPRVNIVYVGTEKESELMGLFETVSGMLYNAEKIYLDLKPTVYLTFVDNGSPIQQEHYELTGKRISSMERAILDNTTVRHIIEGKEEKSYIGKPGQVDVFEKSPMFHIPKEILGGRIYEGTLNYPGLLEMPVILRRYNSKVDDTQIKKKVCDEVKHGEFGNSEYLLFGEWGESSGSILSKINSIYLKNMTPENGIRRIRDFKSNLSEHVIVSLVSAY